MTYLLPILPTPEEAAQVLGRLGAKVRQDRAAEARRAFHRDLRDELGLPPLEALRP